MTPARVRGRLLVWKALGFPASGLIAYPVGMGLLGLVGVRDLDMERRYLITVLVLVVSVVLGVVPLTQRAATYITTLPRSRKDNYRTARRVTLGTALAGASALVLGIMASGFSVEAEHVSLAAKGLLAVLVAASATERNHGSIPLGHLAPTVVLFVSLAVLLVASPSVTALLTPCGILALALYWRPEPARLSAHDGLTRSASSFGAQAMPSAAAEEEDLCAGVLAEGVVDATRGRSGTLDIAATRPDRETRRRRLSTALLRMHWGRACAPNGNHTVSVEGYLALLTILGAASVSVPLVALPLMLLIPEFILPTTQPMLRTLPVHHGRLRLAGIAPFVAGQLAALIVSGLWKSAVALAADALIALTITVVGWIVVRTSMPRPVRLLTLLFLLLFLLHPELTLWLADVRAPLDFDWPTAIGAMVAAYAGLGMVLGFSPHPVPRTARASSWRRRRSRRPSPTGALQGLSSR